MPNNYLVFHSCINLKANKQLESIQDLVFSQQGAFVGNGIGCHASVIPKPKLQPAPASPTYGLTQTVCFLKPGNQYPINKLHCKLSIIHTHKNIEEWFVKKTVRLMESCYVLFQHVFFLMNIYQDLSSSKTSLIKSEHVNSLNKINLRLPIICNVNIS